MLQHPSFLLTAAICGLYCIRFMRGSCVVNIWAQNALRVSPICVTTTVLSMIRVGCICSVDVVLKSTW